MAIDGTCKYDFGFFSKKQKFFCFQKKKEKQKEKEKCH